jgi:hypothetical protein
LNFILSCGQVLQKYDIERDSERAKFDLERDEVQRKFIAAMLGVKLDNGPSVTRKNGDSQPKQTMTQQDIMRSYAK